MKRYKIELVVSDETGSATLTVFDKDVVKFLGVTVAELRKIHSDVLFPLYCLPFCTTFRFPPFFLSFCSHYYFQECNTEDSQASLPVMFDTFLNKRFVFNVTVKVSDRGYAPSFTVSRMSCDDALVKKWDNDNQQGDYSNPIQIGEEVSRTSFGCCYYFRYYFVFFITCLDYCLHMTSMIMFVAI